MSNQFWKRLSDEYSEKDWSKKPSIFATEVYDLIQEGANMLELGCGQGQDGLWFASSDRGITVLATDNEISALDNATKRRDSEQTTSITFEQMDIAQPFPYDDKQFDVVYAHLSLHYFDSVTTKRIFEEIHRVLKPGGLLMFLVNSVTDPEFDTGTKIEEGFFDTHGTHKRYFSVQSAREYAKDFEVMICDENGETYKDADKGVHNLVRFVGRRVT